MCEFHIIFKTVRELGRKGEKEREKKKQLDFEDSKANDEIKYNNVNNKTVVLI